jgi:hypothetical protein
VVGPGHGEEVLEDQALGPADPNPEDADTLENETPLCYAVNSRVLNYEGGVRLQDLLLAHGMQPMPTGACEQYPRSK